MTRFPLQPLLLASVLLTSAAMAHAHDSDGPRNRIDFQSEVSQVMPNDLMRATLSIELSDRNPGQLARALTQAMNEGLAKGRGFSTVKLASGNQQSWPVYNDKQKLESWRGRAELTLESKDFKAAGELLSQLQDKLQLQGLNFVVSEETRQAAEKKLTTDAIAAFREKADAVRVAWGAKSYSLVQMNLGSSGGGGGYPRPPMVMMMKMADAAPAAEMAGGDSRISVNVSGSIELKN
jgi:predicted secreted protein